jgi:hypothetical protein
MKHLRKGDRNLVKGVALCDACGGVCHDSYRIDRGRGEALAQAGMRLL